MEAIISVLYNKYPCSCKVRCYLHPSFLCHIIPHYLLTALCTFTRLTHLVLAAAFEEGVGSTGGGGGEGGEGQDYLEDLWHATGSHIRVHSASRRQMLSLSLAVYHMRTHKNTR